MPRLLIGVLWVLTLAACAADNTEHPLAGELSPLERRLVEQLVEQHEQIVSQARNSAAQEFAPLFRLLGHGDSTGAFVHAAAPCQAPTVFKETCQSDFPGFVSPFGSGIEGCFRDGCLEAGLRFVDVYIISSPHRLPEDRALLRTALDATWPMGTVTYDPNPLTRWIIDARDPGSTVATADMANTVKVSFTDQTSLDMSYSGHLNATSSATDQTFSIMLTLPSIIDRGALEIGISNSANAPLMGQIAIASTVLATVSDGKIIWQ